MPHTWETALQAYRYPVDLRNFDDAAKYPGWFTKVLITGDRKATMEFEEYFRKNGPDNIEVWYEVIFWKLYSTGVAARNDKTRQVALHFQNANIVPQELWDTCARYISDPSRENFNAFRRLFGFAGSGIAIAATFPAFMNSENFPMVDRRVAGWVRHSYIQHNAIDPLGPQLIPPTTKGALKIGHFPFVEKWVLWCKHVADKLTNLTSQRWRARDVEMAVFQAWGKRDPRPKTILTPLP